jgi:putative flippase GtrA
MSFEGSAEDLRETNFIVKLTMDIFINPTSNAMLQLFRTAFAGTLSFVLDAGILYALTETAKRCLETTSLARLASSAYLAATPVAYMLSFLFNFYIVRKYVFPKSKMSFAAELTGYAWIAVIGLVLTEACMAGFTGFLGIYYILSKFLAAIVVMIWSFAARKYWLYKQ